MGEVIVGSHAVTAGTVTRGQLRWNYRAIYPDIYVPKSVEPTLAHRTEGAWLWSGRRGVITGRAAAAAHGSKWIAVEAPVEILHANNRPPGGIVTRRERIAAGEITWINGMAVATPARTGLDLGRHLPRGQAVAHLDALAAASGVTAAAILELTHRYRGTNGVRLCRKSVDLMDAGAQSPKETWLRLVLVDAGFPRPETQIPLFDEFGHAFAYLDMGWRDLKIAVEYDGEQHRTDTVQYRWDARRLRRIMAAGWMHIRVIAGDRPREIEAWVTRAWQLRESEGRVVKWPA
ncbi:Uncharacterised protein [Mycolicibacterium vanbaalenii]|uniref:DUF559 domain-containing protein n=1 Tax=Mycolicibacterium vanbaalenii TaxID=110539 RepID=A0A5S9R4N0_MYCVN|nr:hypothetical protein [Mycolicibacterium vanbaalenii]CAA0128320.1 Uncharacterised protein [Mycolicibacterium vanbaalenii]